MTPHGQRITRGIVAAKGASIEVEWAELRGIVTPGGLSAKPPRAEGEEQDEVQYERHFDSARMREALPTLPRL